MKKTLTKEQMEKLTTKRLLAYLKSWREAPEHEDHEKSMYGGQSQICKEDQFWKDHFEEIKSVLATREHVERK